MQANGTSQYINFVGTDKVGRRASFCALFLYYVVTKSEIENADGAMG